MNVENVEDAYPLTSAQVGMLYHTLSAPDSDVYMAYVVMTLRGSINLALLQESWDATFQRHDSLRAGFLWDGLDEPLQVIFTECSLSWQIDLLPADGSSVSREKIAEAVVQERQVKLDISKAPLSRLRLIETGNNEWILIWAVHHLVVDGWCTPIILSDVVEYYGNKVRGVIDDRGKARAFSEHVHWLANQDRVSAEKHWAHYLANVVPTPISVETTQGELDTPNSSWHLPQRELTLSSENTQLLERFCKSNRVTLSTVVHCIWALVVAHYANTRKPLFGTTTSGRQSGLAGVENAVGLYLNTLPVYLDISEQLVLTALQEFQSSMYQNNQYEYLSLADIQKLVPRADGQALFNSILVLESHSADEHFQALGADLVISDINYTTHSNYPLALLVVPGEELMFRLVYDDTEFEPSHIDDMLGHVDSLLHAMQVEPENTSMQALSNKIVLLRQLPRCYGGTEVESGHTSLQAWIESTCDLSPDRVVIRASGKSWTFSALDQRANQIARSIRNNVLDDEQLIGVACPRSFEQVAALLGVLKAGLGYVPLNPDHPEAQLSRIISEAGISVIICAEHSRASLSTLDVQIMTVEETADSSSSRVASGNTTANSLAYVMYTSGSSGAPKGVMVTHANVIYSTQARIDYYKNSSPTFLLLSAMTFDSSVAGLYWTLCGGGTLILPETDEEKDLHRVGQLIRTHQVTHTLCLPSLYRLMLDYIEADQRSSLRAVIVAGEQCTSDLVDSHNANSHECRLYNEYGPTEATVWSSVADLTETAENGVSIGRPIGDTLLMIMTESGQLCPAGVEGELVIGGKGVSTGYYRQAALTAERFVENPVNTEDVLTVFKTGDIGFWNTAGNIQFTGRADRQLKIRGNRIEPAEIESTLMGLAEITEVAVVGLPVSTSARTAPTKSGSQEEILQALSGMSAELADSLLNQVEQLDKESPDVLGSGNIPIDSQAYPHTTTDPYL